MVAPPSKAPTSPDAQACLLDSPESMNKDLCLAGCLSEEGCGIELLVAVTLLLELPQFYCHSLVE